MKSSDIDKIGQWRRRNNLSQNQYFNLIEAFRRINMFHGGDINATMVLLAFPSEVKPSKEFFSPYGRETKRVMNWYKLSDEGKEKLKDLDIKWDEKEMNHYIFTM